MDREDFYNYVYEFYNADTGIYKNVAATRFEIIDATRKMEREHAGHICYDSVDRVRVRDIIIESRT